MGIEIQKPNNSQDTQLNINYEKAKKEEKALTDAEMNIDQIAQKYGVTDKSMLNKKGEVWYHGDQPVERWSNEMEGLYSGNDNAEIYRSYSKH